MPSSRAGLYAFKPALNAVIVDGVFKSSIELDVVGGHARSTADLTLLSQVALTEEKRALLPPEGYKKFLTKTFDSLRKGSVDPTKWSLHPDIVQLDEQILAQMNNLHFDAIEWIKNHAAGVAYPVDIPLATDMWYEGQNPITVVMAYEGKDALEAWLEDLEVPGLKTIEDLIKFNDDNREKGLPEDHPDRNQLLNASRSPRSKETYDTVKKLMKTVAKENGIDKLFNEQDLNTLAFPMDSLMVFISAASGYPIATVPLGVSEAAGRHMVLVSWLGRAVKT